MLAQWFSMIQREYLRNRRLWRTQPILVANPLNLKAVFKRRVVHGNKEEIEQPQVGCEEEIEFARRFVLGTFILSQVGVEEIILTPIVQQPDQTQLVSLRRQSQIGFFLPRSQVDFTAEVRSEGAAGGPHRNASLTAG
jgi:hypothetical protein